MEFVYSISLTICAFVAILFFWGLLYACVIFLQEKEKRASYRALLISFLLPVPYLLAWFYSWEILALILAADIILTVILFLIPFKVSKNIQDDFPGQQIDERDTIFSRNELVPRSEKYEAYYQKFPQREQLDNEFRKEPGLVSKDSLFYNPFACAATKAGFFAVEQFHNAVDGPVNYGQGDISTKKMSVFLKGWGKKLGALNIGFTNLSDYHFYSHKGRRNEYGNEIKNPHTHAIAFTVEMSREMVGPAPQSSIVMESGQQYLESGRIAIQIAQFLRNLGYSARAHIDGNYQVVCPLVARDAGLGDIGRMGLLMTPREGPRVRLGVVTTNFKLPVNKWKKDHSLHDFCNRCKKCAEVCPSKSISFDPPKMTGGIKRWQINSETCFTYWCKAGTDCGRCMAACPYSHPDNFLHNFIRWGIKRSSLFRMLAIPLDDFFFGKKPKPSKMPKWIPND